MVAGMTVANLLGVPLGTFVSQYISWRLVFALVAAVAVALWWALRRWIPDLASLPSSGLRDQFRFLGTPAPWLLLGATLLGNGGIFCWYSYVHPMLTQIAGFSENQAGGLMMLAGASMVAGNILGGQLSDRYTPGKVASILQLVGAAALLLIFFTAHIPALAVIWMCVCTFCLFAVSSPQQLLLLRYSPGGALLGAAAVQMAFNLGNALGAYNGGLAISHHWGLPYTALIGVPMALAGFVCLAYFHRHWELIPRRQAAQPKDAS
jgi:DHA1 family arabinose polymer transporter-like MFS transporter